MKQLSCLMVFAASFTLGASLCHGQTALGGGVDGGNPGGQRRGGISYVTRRVPMAVPNQNAAGFFAAAGVPVGGGAAGGGLNAPGGGAFGSVRLANNQAFGTAPLNEGEIEPLSPAAVQVLQVLARKGDKDAIATLAQFRAQKFETPGPMEVPAVAPESE